MMDDYELDAYYQEQAEREQAKRRATMPGGVTGTQFTPVYDPNGRPDGYFAVVVKFGKISWARFPEFPTDSELGLPPNPELFDFGTVPGRRYSENDFGPQDWEEMLRGANVINQVVPFNELLGHAIRPTNSALVPASSAVGSPQVGGNNPLSHRPSFAVRVPTAVTGIFQPTPSDYARFRVYRIIDSELVLQSRDSIPNFKAVRRSSPDDSFPLFAYLPAEVRALIWKEAIPGPRKVAITSVYGATDSPTWLVKSFNAGIPSILHACSESRVIGLEVLTPTFRSDLPGGQGILTYINTAEDAIAMNYYTTLAMSLTENPLINESREKLRHIQCYMAINPRNPNVHDIARTVLHRVRGVWANLETWTFPGVEENNLTGRETVDWLCINLKRPTNYDKLKRATKRLEKMIREELEYLWEKNDRRGRIGIRIRYRTPTQLRAHCQSQMNQGYEAWEWEWESIPGL